jgi:hypothetical protein
MQHFANFGIVKATNKIKRRDFDATGFQPSSIPEILQRKEKAIQNYKDNPYLNQPDTVKHSSTPFLRNTSSEIVPAPKELNARALKDAEIRADAKRGYEKFINTPDYDIIRNTVTQEKNRYISDTRGTRLRSNLDPLENTSRLPYTQPSAQRIIDKRLADPRRIGLSKQNGIVGRGNNRFDMRGGVEP